MYPLFAGRAQVHQEPCQHAEAAARATPWMSGERISAIFEAVFESDGARTRADMPIRGKVPGP